MNNKVVYAGGLTVNLGTMLTPTQVKTMPTVTWNGRLTDFYTLIMLGEFNSRKINY